MKKSMRKRFEEKIQFGDGCWNWQAGKNNKGYGTFFLNGKTVYAHRISYMLYIGEIPEVDNYHGACVLHVCDNPACVNPNHLLVGTQADNMLDKKLKGRTNNGRFTGENHHNAKLSKLEVEKIRKMYSGGKYTQKQLGKIFGVTQGAIHKITSGMGWKHI